MKGCAYSLASVKTGELFFPVGKGDLMAHDVGSRLWVNFFHKNILSLLFFYCKPLNFNLFFFRGGMLIHLPPSRRVACA